MMSEKQVAEIKADSPSPSRTPTSADEALPVLDPQIEKRILRKLDFKVVPILFFLFLVSFVDRSNIGKYSNCQTQRGHY